MSKRQMREKREMFLLLRILFFCNGRCGHIGKKKPASNSCTIWSIELEKKSTGSKTKILKFIVTRCAVKKNGTTPLNVKDKHTLEFLYTRSQVSMQIDSSFELDKMAAVSCSTSQPLCFLLSGTIHLIIIEIKRNFRHF